MLTERENILIECLVKDYIARGNAISSDRLLEKTGLKYSTATIRKDLIKLETLGLVESTHVSSGRVPTVKGYRYYIDNNLKRKPLSKLIMMILQKLDIIITHSLKLRHFSFYSLISN